jgi:hypothetical protein
MDEGGLSRGKSPMTPPSRRRAWAVALLFVLYLLHQDFWFWTTARPLVLGWLPVGLFYHAAYTIATSLVLAVCLRALWPSELEDVERGPR